MYGQLNTRRSFFYAKSLLFAFQIAFDFFHFPLRFYESTHLDERSVPNFLFNFTRDMFPNRVMNAGFLCGGKIYCAMRNSEVLYCCVMWNLRKCTSDCYRTTLIVRIPFPWHLLADLQSHVVVPWPLFAWLLDWFSAAFCDLRLLMAFPWPISVFLASSFWSCNCRWSGLLAINLYDVVRFPKLCERATSGNSKNKCH
jgi:hypothetical protein